MTSIHPHWNSTHDDPKDVDAVDAGTSAPIHVSETIRIPIGAATVSRRPAAVMGILVVLVVGFAFIDGFASIRGEVPPSGSAKSTAGSVEIRITKNGMDPKKADVRPGQEIVWINEHDIPHILESETLVSDKGATLYTKAIFPGEEERFTLAPNHKPGRHTYLSTTSIDIFGEINVVENEGLAANDDQDLFTSESAAVENDPAEEESPFSFGSFGDDEDASEFSSNEQTIASDDRLETIDSSDPLGPLGVVDAALGSEEESSQTSESALPYNPYTVGSTRQHPFDEGGAPLTGDSLHGGAPLIGKGKGKPPRQPGTGPALWIVSLASLAVVYGVTRKYFASVKAKV